LGERLLKVRRLSRLYYRGRFFRYPLDLLNALSNLGVAESVLILSSYLWARLWPYREEKTLEQWVTNRFGHRLYKTFFQAYTEKVWGIPCHEIQADWAAHVTDDSSVERAPRRQPRQNVDRRVLLPRLGAGDDVAAVSERGGKPGGRSTS